MSNPELLSLGKIQSTLLESFEGREVSLSISIHCSQNPLQKCFPKFIYVPSLPQTVYQKDLSNFEDRFYAPSLSTVITSNGHWMNGSNGRATYIIKNNIMEWPLCDFNQLPLAISYIFILIGMNTLGDIWIYFSTQQFLSQFKCLFVLGNRFLCHYS